MKTGILIHPSELSKRWIDRMANGGISTLGIHPEGGGNSIASLTNLIETLEDGSFRALIDYATERGLRVEYEFHAFGYLLPRELFASHPEYFRMDSNGKRTERLNFCPSSREALDIVAKSAAQLSKKLYKSSANYFFWSDDARGGVCHCPLCKDLSPSDQQLTVLNAIIKEIRRSVPDAKLAYLAYYDTLELPVKVVPESGIFLEYAPIDKWHVRYGKDTKESRLGVQKERLMLKELLVYFGKKDSRVLEYWIDNSLFSGWKKPPVNLAYDGDLIRRDIKEYLDAGYEDISTFGCFLGDDYEALYGEPDICGLLSAFKSI